MEAVYNFALGLIINIRLLYLKNIFVYKKSDLFAILVVCRSELKILLKYHFVAFTYVWGRHELLAHHRLYSIGVKVSLRIVIKEIIKLLGHVAINLRLRLVCKILLIHLINLILYVVDANLLIIQRGRKSINIFLMPLKPLMRHHGVVILKYFPIS